VFLAPCLLLTRGPLQMKFLDLLRPKWRRSDPKARKEAVRTLQDAGVLRRIAETDTDDEVCRAALAKLPDDVRVRIATASGREHNQLAAVQIVTDATLLAEAAWKAHNKAVALAALDRITADASLLAEVAWKSHNETVALAALDRIAADASLLAKVALKSRRDAVALAAIERIDSDEFLAEVAQGRTAERRRVAAAARVSDEAVLMAIVRKVSAPSVRACAVERVTDQPFLEGIAKGAYEPPVRLAAIRRLLDKDLLVSIAKRESDPLEVRSLAADRAGDAELVEAVEAEKRSKRGRMPEVVCRVQSLVKPGPFTAVSVRLSRIPQGDDMRSLVPHGLSLLGWYTLEEEESGGWVRLVMVGLGAQAPKCSYCGKPVIPVHDIMTHVHGANIAAAVFGGVRSSDWPSSGAEEGPPPSVECTKGLTEGPMVCESCGSIVCMMCRAKWGFELSQGGGSAAGATFQKPVPAVHCQKCLTPTLGFLTESRWSERAPST